MRHHSRAFSNSRLIGNLLALGVLVWLVLYGVQGLTGWLGATPFLGCWAGPGGGAPGQFFFWGGGGPPPPTPPGYFYKVE